MTAVNREQVYSALANLLFTATGVVAQFATTGRSLRIFDDVTAEQCPALFIIQKGESWRRPGKGIPPVRTLNCHLVLYTFTGDRNAPLPATLCNGVLDAVDAVLNPPEGQPQNIDLGGLVEHVYLEGEIIIAEGLLQEVSVVVVPISILLP